MQRLFSLLLALLVLFSEFYGQEYLVYRSFQKINIHNLEKHSTTASENCICIDDFVVADNKLFAAISSSYQGKPLCNEQEFWGKLVYTRLDSNNEKIGFDTLDTLYSGNIQKMYMSPEKSKILLQVKGHGGNSLSPRYLLLSVDKLNITEINAVKEKYFVGWRNEDDLIFLDDSGFAVFNIQSNGLYLHWPDNSVRNNICENYSNIDSSSFIVQLCDPSTGDSWLNKYSSDGTYQLQTLYASPRKFQYSLSEDKRNVFILNSEDYSDSGRIYYLMKIGMRGEIHNKISLNKVFNNRLPAAIFILSEYLQDGGLIIGYDSLSDDGNSGIYNLSLKGNSQVEKSLLIPCSLSVDSEIKVSHRAL